MDDVRKPRQRHRQRTGLLDPSHFQVGWVGRSFLGIVSDQGPVSYKGLEFVEDPFELWGILDLVLGNASQAVNKAFRGLIGVNVGVVVIDFFTVRKTYGRHLDDLIGAFCIG